MHNNAPSVHNRLLYYIAVWLLKTSVVEPDGSGTKKLYKSHTKKIIFLALE